MPIESSVCNIYNTQWEHRLAPLDRAEIEVIQRYALSWLVVSSCTWKQTLNSLEASDFLSTSRCCEQSVYRDITGSVFLFRSIGQQRSPRAQSRTWSSWDRPVSLARIAWLCMPSFTYLEQRWEQQCQLVRKQHNSASIPQVRNPPQVRSIIGHAVWQGRLQVGSLWIYVSIRNRHDRQWRRNARTWSLEPALHLVSEWLPWVVVAVH